jgi:hypothetical protein
MTPPTQLIAWLHRLIDVAPEHEQRAAAAPTLRNTLARDPHATGMFRREPQVLPQFSDRQVRLRAQARVVERRIRQLARLNRRLRRAASALSDDIVALYEADAALHDVLRTEQTTSASRRNVAARP